MQKSADRRAKRVESDYFEIESKLRQMESELASERIMRDGFRADKEKVNPPKISIKTQMQCLH